MNTEFACRALYREAFSDPDTSFENILFKNCFKHCKVLKKNGTAASMLFALPCELSLNGEADPAIYIYAAATAKQFRGIGCMTELIRELCNTENAVFFLRPATASLIGFYGRLGFKVLKTENAAATASELVPTAEFKSLITEAALPPEDGRFTLMYYDKSGRRPSKIKFLYSME